MNTPPNLDAEHDAGLDPDEDLFAFGDPAALPASEPSESDDLEEIFASFDEEQEERAHFAGEPARSTSEALATGATAPAPPAALPAASVAHRARPALAPTLARAEAPAPLPRPAPLAVPATASEPEASAAAREPARPRRTRLLSGTSLAMLVAVVVVNGLVALLTLRTAAHLQETLAVKEAPLPAPERVREHAVVDPGPRGASPAEATLPLVPPDAESHPVFERVRAELERGEYPAACRRLYALLAVVDRLEPASRRDVEARAHYFLARARHLQAVERMESERAEGGP